jgi:hypothetical protein
VLRLTPVRVKKSIMPDRYAPFLDRNADCTKPRFRCAFRGFPV